MTDEHLLQRLRVRTPDSVEAMMKKYGGYVYTVLANVLGKAGRPEDIEELSQDVFYAVWNHREDIQGNLKAYLGTTARNRAKSWLRGRKELPMSLDLVELPDKAASLEDRAVQQEISRKLRQAVDGMRPSDRETFLRYYFYLQNTEEIAQRMEVPVSTVCSRLARGRKRLRKILGEEAAL